jgi:hypothetical protein
MRPSSRSAIETVIRDTPTSSAMCFRLTTPFFFIYSAFR